MLFSIFGNAKVVILFSTIYTFLQSSNNAMDFKIISQLTKSLFSTDGYLTKLANKSSEILDTAQSSSKILLKQ